MHGLATMLSVIIRRMAVPILAAVFALIGFWWGAGYLPGRAAQSRNAGLLFSVAVPVPITQARASGVPELRRALGQIRKALPSVTVVHLIIENATTSERDWVALLDAVRVERFRAVVAFADRDEQANYTGFRPVFAGGQWQAGSLTRFAACAKCVAHPALYAVQVVDEPWHHQKRPFYTSNELNDLIAHLRSLAPRGGDVRWYVQFSRELWKNVQDRPRPETIWSASLGNMVQISALEFQDRQYQFVLLDQNHYWSRRIVHDRTPDIPLWTSVQVMGNGYGPAAGYWFPGRLDLLRLLNDLTSAKYQIEHPLSGLMFQQWDSVSERQRPKQFTLGDRYLKGQPPAQMQASEEALRTINAWIREAPEAP